MSVFIGGINPVKLIEEIMNKLIKNGFMTKEEAEQMVQNSKG